jgi:hypoxanthine-DNA glycosylase
MAPRPSPLLPERASAARRPTLAGLPPVHDRTARVLILGSFPGVASLSARQYYAHPRNLFWPALSSITGEDLVALDYDSRLFRLQHHGIALWDIIGRCLRQGSLDGAIREAVDQDFAAFIEQLPALQAVAFNGRLAATREPWFKERGLRTYRLPSTSPAYAAVPRTAKLEAWRILAGELVRAPARHRGVGAGGAVSRPNVVPPPGPG